MEALLSVISPSERCNRWHALECVFSLVLSETERLLCNLGVYRAACNDYFNHRRQKTPVAQLDNQNVAQRLKLSSHGVKLPLPPHLIIQMCN